MGHSVSAASTYVKRYIYPDMSTDWSPLALLAAEFTFAVLFVRALLSYLQQRDPLQRNVMLVFAPCMVLFCADLARRINGESFPAWVGVITLTILLAQPYLTVRLAGRLRHVPVWLDRAVLLTYVGTAGPLMLASRPLHPSAWIVAVTGFLAGELVAAGLLFGKARTRSGANRARLMTAAGATLAFGMMIVLLGVGSLPGTDPGFDTANRVMALVSGVGYLVAFLPPRVVRRLFAASAAHSVTERLLRAPVESPEQVWQIYAEIMRTQTGADAVAVFMPRPDGVLAPTAYAGPPIPTPEELGSADLTALIRAGQPARLREGSPVLVEHFGDDLGDDFVSVLSMPVPPHAEGAVLLFNSHRSLFRDDDLRLLAALGGQAAILADRQAITAAQRRMATELSASVEALTRASQAKSSFLANMSHELRTPLNAIIGFSDLMRLEEPDGDRRTVPAEWIEHIHTSGRHLLGLINDILDLAKVEAGRLDLRLAPLRADAAVSELLTGLSPLLATKHLAVSTELAEATVLVDRVRFRQIVENLLSNAIKFTPEGGAITVSVTGGGDDILVTVADTGVGIAEADQGRVFEEFQQVGDPDHRRAGTGLGLALTKRLVEAHDGELTLVSELAKGSSFTVRLPAAPAVRPAPASSTSVDDAPHAARVLLIEDDTQAAELLHTQLHSAGYTVEVTVSGESGLAAAVAQPPDAIVLDIRLPGMDGWDVIRQLKGNERLAGIPVIIASILDERQAALALGADEYLVKPVDRGALLGALARAVATRPTPRVLVVDSDEAVRQAIEEGLRAGGADVVACATNPPGIALSRAADFDLIVGDVNAPLLATVEQTPVVGVTAADPPLVATAKAGGPGWEAMAPLLGAGKDEP
jgi:signal transduction histidine kinase/DNA-binding response OmpR family regulator